MRLTTALTILACVGLIMSVTMVQGKTEKKEEPSTIKKMAAHVADLFIKDKETSEEVVDAVKDGNWWDKIKAGAGAAVHAVHKHREEEEDEEDEVEKSWVEKLKFWGKSDDDDDEKDKEKKDKLDKEKDKKEKEKNKEKEAKDKEKEKKEKAKKEKDEDDDDSKTKWAEKLMFWKLFQKSKDKGKEMMDDDDKSWIDSIKFWKSKEKESEKEEDEGFSFKNWADTFKFWEKNKLQDKVDAKTKELKEQVKATDKKIQKAIDKQKKGIDKIMKQVHLPKIEFPEDIKDSFKNIKTENIKFKECIHYLKPALPGLLSFGYHASRDHSTRAVQALFKVLKRLPDISRTCIGEEVQLTESEVDDKKCVKDIVALTELLTGLAKHPYNIIGAYKRMKKMINLVPQCISHCTTAFEVESS